MIKFWRSIWPYRGFIRGSIQREFQSKYRNSLLGAAWTIINPLAMIVVYTVIFSQVMRAKLPGVDNAYGYSIYLCAGIITWGLFAEITARSQTMFLDNANMLKKLSFPRITLPVIVVLNAMLNFGIILGLFFVFLLTSGAWPGWVSLALLPILLVQVILATGLGMVLGVLNVFFRDVGQFFGIFLQFWFWLTPIVYPVSILPPGVKAWMTLNPMYPITSSYQGIFVQGLWPNWATLTAPLALGLLLCFAGLRLFQRHSGDMVDEL
jgi:lipopolysaccharide transport system permease protein